MCSLLYSFRIGDAFKVEFTLCSDKGSLSLKVEVDNDYSIVFGNLNSHKISVSLKIPSLVYTVYIGCFVVIQVNESI